VIGNIGRPGITLLIPASTSEIREPNPEHWNLVNHNQFDGRLEDAFANTSLHIRFTGYELPLETGTLGSRFIEVSFAEAVIAVHESGQWIADIDVIRSLNSTRLHRLSQGDNCQPAPVGQEPLFNVTAIENWDEILDSPAAPAVFKTHGNWQARLAATCISVGLKHNVLLFHNHGCWHCAHQAMLSLKNSAGQHCLPNRDPKDIIFIL
jgi:hypothetical protein